MREGNHNLASLALLITELVVFLHTGPYPHQIYNLPEIIITVPFSIHFILKKHRIFNSLSYKSRSGTSAVSLGIVDIYREEKVKSQGGKFRV